MYSVLWGIVGQTKNKATMDTLDEAVEIASALYHKESDSSYHQGHATWTAVVFEGETRKSSLSLEW